MLTLRYGVKLNVTDATIAWAQANRAMRDRFFSTYFDGPMRWVGDCFESVLSFYLPAILPPDVTVEWFVDCDPRTHPDFRLGGCVDLSAKAISRKGPVQGHYAAPVNVHHVDDPAAWFLFGSFDATTSTMWFLGAMRCEEFRERSDFIAAGTEEANGFVCRADMYRVPVSTLLPPADWAIAVTADVRALRPDPAA